MKQTQTFSFVQSVPKKLTTSLATPNLARYRPWKKRIYQRRNQETNNNFDSDFKWFKQFITSLVFIYVLTKTLACHKKNLLSTLIISETFQY